jgi:membrane protein
MALPWPRRLQDWWRLSRRMWVQAVASEVPSRCSELAYAFLFSVFPLLFFLTTLMGYAAASRTGPLSRYLLSYLRGVSPSPQITGLLQGALDDITRGRGGFKLSLSLLAGLWAASSGTLAYGRILTDVGGWKDPRPWWWRRLVAILLTLTFGVLCVAALLLVLYGREIGAAVADQIGQGPVFIASWHILKWPIALGFVVLSFDLIYNFAPGHRNDLHWLTPGAFVAIAGWLVSSFGLRLYLEAVPTSSTYGSIAAVIILLVWFWVTSFAILLGGLLNVELEPVPPRPVPRATSGRAQRRR